MAYVSCLFMYPDSRLHNTLRVLMSPPLTLRTNISVIHSQHASNYALELSRANDGSLAVVELCADGELLSGRAVAGPGEAAALDEQALACAMTSLWQDEPDDLAMAADVVSVRVISLLLVTDAAAPFKVVQTWYYRVRDGVAQMDIWGDDKPLMTRPVTTPAARSVKGLVVALQALANKPDLPRG